MDLGLSGRTALVCGASSGLGLASAEALAEEGANVVLLARRAEQLDEHAARLNGADRHEHRPDGIRNIEQRDDFLTHRVRRFRPVQLEPQR